MDCSYGQYLSKLENWAVSVLEALSCSPAQTDVWPGTLRPTTYVLARRKLKMVAWFDKRRARHEQYVVNWDDDDYDRRLYKRILVAIDDNTWSHHAITQAVQIAAQTGASLIVLMVPSSPLLTYTPDGLGIANGLETLVKEGEAVLEWAAASAEDAGVPYTTIFKWGCLVPTILDVSNQQHCDLIVMGLPVRARWERFLRPCHATYVATHARQPVLVVKAHPSAGDG